MSCRPRCAIVLLGLLAASCSLKRFESHGDGLSDFVTVEAERAYDFRSPDGEVLIKVSPEGQKSSVAVFRSGTLVQRFQIEAPASLHWKPAGHQAFLNDGQGSGEWSRFVTISGERSGPSAADLRISQALQDTYRGKSTCVRDGFEPSISGLGWESQRRVLVYISSMNHGSCVPDENFLALVDPVSASVLRTISLEEGRALYPALVADRQ